MKELFTLSGLILLVAFGFLWVRPVKSGDVGDSLSDEALKWIDCHLDATSMDTLNATPVNCVPAPGAGKVLQFLGALSFNDFNTVAFAPSSAEVQFRYANSTGAISGIIPAHHVSAGADAHFSVTTSGQASSTVASGAIAQVNQPLVAFASTDITAGNGSLKVRVFYRILTITDI